MEKYARQAINDGVTSTEELSITRDCELYRALNMHYNKANDFEVRCDLSGFLPLLCMHIIEIPPSLFYAFSLILETVSFTVPTLRMMLMCFVLCFVKKGRRSFLPALPESRKVFCLDSRALHLGCLHFRERFS